MPLVSISYAYSIQEVEKTMLIFLNINHALILPCKFFRVFPRIVTHCLAYSCAVTLVFISQIQRLGMTFAE